MENVLEIVSVPVIVGIVYFVMAVYKTLVKNAPAIWTSLIPVWAAVLGIGLGVLAYYLVPDVMPADNVLVAVLVGLASGLGAVGVHQVGKQIEKANSEKDGTDDDGNA